MTAPTFENRRRYEDGSVLHRIHKTRESAVADVAQMIEDDDEYEYEATFVVYRDTLDRPVNVRIINLIPAAREWLRDNADDPPIRSMKHRQTWGRVPA